MKTCSVCGLHVEDDYLYCWEDGTRLIEAAAVPALQNPLSGTLESVRMASSRENGVASGPSILYCPACAGAFPLTFDLCPVDHLPLTTKSFNREYTPEMPPPSEAPDAQIVTAEPVVQFDHRSTVHLRESTTETLTRSEAGNTSESETSSFRFLTLGLGEVRDRTRDLLEETGSKRAARRHGRSPDRTPDFVGAGEPDALDAPKGMRLAARATAIALILITLAGIYLIYSMVTRTPSRSPIARQNNIAQPESPLIATPQEARDYRGESEPALLPGIADQESGAAIDRTGQPGELRLDSAPRTALAGPARSGLANLTAGSFDPRPVVGGGRFSTQLVRLRSYRSPTGYRYTLTFRLYEQAGRPMQWQRLSVVTHSANGATHSDSLPFQYVLGGSGSLTFTINVEMAGASEADWRGHISCTSVGADDSGRPLRASFGTDVAP